MLHQIMQKWSMQGMAIDENTTLVYDHCSPACQLLWYPTRSSLQSIEKYGFYKYLEISSSLGEENAHNNIPDIFTYPVSYEFIDDNCLVQASCFYNYDDVVLYLHTI